MILDTPQPWDRVCDNSNPPFVKWFPGGELSLCYNAVDRHVDEGWGEQAALVWDSPITGSGAVMSYSQLQAEVARLAGLLARLGVGRGDRVLIYMPMVPEAVVAMGSHYLLRCSRALLVAGSCSNWCSCFSATTCARLL